MDAGDGEEELARPCRPRRHGRCCSTGRRDGESELGARVIYFGEIIGPRPRGCARRMKILSRRFRLWPPAVDQVIPGGLVRTRRRYYEAQPGSTGHFTPGVQISAPPALMGLSPAVLDQTAGGNLCSAHLGLPPAKNITNRRR